MGHEAFGVDLDALGVAEQGIRDAVDELGGQGTWLLTQDLDAVGHDGLADALWEFRERWHWAFRELVDDGRSAADALRDTREWYQKADDQAQKVLRDAWDTLSSPPSDPTGNVNTDNGPRSAESVLQGHAARAQAQQNWNAAWEDD